MTAAARSAAFGPGLPCLLAGLLPCVERDLGADLATAVLTVDPARPFAAHWRDAG